MSEKINLLPDEKIIQTPLDNRIILTSKRIRIDSPSVGSSDLVSMTLEAVASCRLVTRSYQLLVLLALLLIIPAFLTKELYRWISIGGSLVLLIAYLRTRYATLEIASKGGGTITLRILGTKRRTIVAFIDAVEQEKMRFLQRKAICEDSSRYQM